MGLVKIVEPEDLRNLEEGDAFLITDGDRIVRAQIEKKDNDIYHATVKELCENDILGRTIIDSENAEFQDGYVVAKVICDYSQ